MLPSAYNKAAQAVFLSSLLVFFYELFAYNVILLGQAYPASGNDALVMPLGILFNGVWALAMVSFLRAHCTDAGRVPLRWQVFVGNVGGAMPVTLARQEWQPRTATLCTRCKTPRPERAHHCALCNQCVLRYDHHCPWINNCVGFQNHKYFLLLAFYTLLTSTVVLLSAVPILPQCTRVAMSFEASATGNEDNISQLEACSLLIFVFLAFCAFLLLISVLHCHLPLAMQNLTTVEDFYDNMSNPFDQGSAISNLAQVLGKPGPDWLLPVQPWRPVTDGIAFPSLPGNLADRHGLDLSDMSVKTRSRVMIGDEEMVVEELWKLQYNVRPEPRRWEMQLDDCSEPGAIRLRSCLPSKLLGFASDDDGFRFGKPPNNRRAVWI